MRVHVSRHRDVEVLEFRSGAVLDCSVAADVKAQALRQLDGRSDLVINLANLEFVDSAGLGVLVGVYKRVNLRGRRVVVAAAAPYVAHVMKIIKLDRVFDSFPDVPAAIAELSRGVPVGSGGTRTLR